MWSHHTNEEGNVLAQGMPRPCWWAHRRNPQMAVPAFMKRPAPQRVSWACSPSLPASAAFSLGELGPPPRHVHCPCSMTRHAELPMQCRHPVCSTCALLMGVHVNDRAVHRYDTGVISGALPYLRDDLLSAYKSDASRQAAHPAPLCTAGDAHGALLHAVPWCHTQSTMEHIAPCWQGQCPQW